MGCGAFSSSSSNKTSPFSPSGPPSEANVNHRNQQNHDGYDKHGRFQQGAGFTKPSETCPGMESLDLGAAFGSGFHKSGSKDHSGHVTTTYHNKNIVNHGHGNHQNVSMGKSKSEPGSSRGPGNLGYKKKGNNMSMNHHQHSESLPELEVKTRLTIAPGEQMIYGQEDPKSPHESDSKQIKHMEDVTNNHFHVSSGATSTGQKIVDKSKSTNSSVNVSHVNSSSNKSLKSQKSSGHHHSHGKKKSKDN